MSSEEGSTKPNPLIFERAATRMGVFPDECLFVDDNQENCNGAELAGMHSVLYTTNEALESSIANKEGIR
jgi:putative hydrolase of the HAD superfamily